MESSEEPRYRLDVWAGAVAEALENAGVDRFNDLPEADQAHLDTLAFPIWPALVKIHESWSEHEGSDPSAIFKELWPELDLSDAEKQQAMVWALATACIEAAVKRLRDTD